MSTLDDNDPPCTFCEIAAGRLAADVLYEDDYVVGFLDRSPATAGHALVVSRNHRRDIWEISPEEGTAAFNAARLLAEDARSELNAVGINLKQATACPGRRAEPGGTGESSRSDRTAVTERRHERGRLTSTRTGATTDVQGSVRRRLLVKRSVTFAASLRSSL